MTTSGTLSNMRLLALLLLTTTACATVSKPLSATRVAEVRTREAILTHLAQSQASGELCDARLSRDLLADASLQDAIIDAWVDGTISHAVFGRCLELSLETLEPSVSQELLDALVPLYERLLSDDDLERSASKRERLRTLHVALLERPVGVDATRTVVKPRIERLRTLLGELGPIRAQFATEVLEVDDLEAGQWSGAAITTAALEQLVTSRKEPVLLRAARRLPSEALRVEAARRLIRLRIATSTFQELGTKPGDVEATVLRYGNNPIDLDHAHIEKAWLTRDPTWPQGLEVDQPRGAGFHALQASSGILPTLNLRGVVWAQVEGVSQALTMCREGRPLDPTPCLPDLAISIPSPVVKGTGHARFEFNDDLERSQSFELAGADRLRLPVHLDGAVMGWLEWTMRYLPGASIEHVARTAGGTGPTVKVRAKEHLLSKRVLFEVDGAGSRDWRVIEAEDLGRFQIVSRGGEGEVGASGVDGVSGSSGGECSDGGAGGAGGDGGPGGPGGIGGEVLVALQCLDTPCGDESLARLSRAIVSRGGKGGLGGAGGSGGSGGSGGASRSPRTHTDSNGQLVTDDAGCSAGSDGPRGSDGNRGPSGPDGKPGRVVFQDVGDARQL